MNNFLAIISSEGSERRQQKEEEATKRKMEQPAFLFSKVII
jgi:hypothetical protein